jgi:type VI secretion system protein ImpL
MIEISGKHVDPAANQSACDAGWNSLLASITADINTHQIASIVVCVSPEELAEAKIEATFQGMQIIRQRITDLMGLSGKRLPVYVVLTKVDLIGLKPLIKVLPESLLAQPAGALLPADQLAITSSSLQDSILEITRYLPWLAMRSYAAGFDPGKTALTAYQSLLNLQASLDSLILRLFGASNYLEAPVYRGLFLSADLEKADISFNKQFDSPRLAFGSGVLKDVLLKDRIFQPLTSYERRIKQRQKLMWLSYYSAVSAITFWLLAGFSYQADQLTRLKDLKLPALSKSSESTASFVNAVFEMQPIINWNLNREFSGWNFFLPFSGATSDIEEVIKKRFVDTYTAFDRDILAKKLTEVYESSPLADNKLIGVTISAMLGRIKIIESALQGDSLQRIVLLPTPSETPITFVYPEISPNKINAINNLFYYYVYYLRQEGDLNVHLFAARSFLEKVALSDKSLTWIIPWAIQQPSVVDLWLSDYWAPSGTPQGEKVFGPYTIQGQTVIRKFLNQINSEPILNKIYGEEIVRFEKGYQLQREVEWRKFLLGFDEGKNLLKTAEAWQQTLSSFGASNSPYSMLADRVLQEYPNTASIDDRPAWVSSIEFIQTLRESALNKSYIGDIAGKLKVLGAISKLNNSNQGVQEKDISESRTLYKTFLEASDKVLTNALSSPGNAAGLAIDFSGLGIDPSYKSSAMRDAVDALQRLKDHIGVKSQPWNAPAWVVLEGPLKTTVAYTYNQAACSVQSAWNSNVIYPTKLVTTEAEMFQKTFGEQGTLWAYIDKTAKPFLTISASNFINTVVDGWSIDWDDNFIPFLNSAASDKRTRDTAIKKAELEDKLADTRDEARIKEIVGRIQDIESNQTKFSQTNFSIQINALPVQANSMAKSLPFGAAITLSCASSQQRLTQLNFSVSQTFNWKLNSCGDTELQIFVGNQTLTKLWPGEFGFSQFLSTFKTGKKTFLTKNFPEQSQSLEQLGIEKIDVFFKLSGASSFVQAAKQYQEEAIELASIKAAKAKLEKAVSDRQIKKLATELAALMNSKTKPTIPEKIANCPY